MKLKCPRCQNQLKEIVYEGIKIDTCEKCKGEWLDHKEIVHIRNVAQEIFSEEEKEKVKGAKEAVVTKVSQAKEPLICPHCQEPLQRQNYAYSTGIIIDRCPKCNGIWLDKDEIEHVQIVAEEWKKRLPEIKRKFAPILAQLRKEVEKEGEESLDVGYKWIKNPLTDAIVYGLLFRFFD